MDARLVFDGGPELHVPPSMGVPLPDQLDGTPLENLGELASRICYESLGVGKNGKRRGRPGSKLHEHILEVRNLSVYEHCTFTVVIPYVPRGRETPLLLALANRKGVWVEPAVRGEKGLSYEVTANLRAVLEWGRHARPWNRGKWADAVGGSLTNAARRLAPRIVRGPPLRGVAGAYEKTGVLNPDQAHVTLWLYGSRGFTHEQVRHRFAMSQRSTRYVDEDGSPYVEHPLLSRYLNDPDVPRGDRAVTQLAVDASIAADRATYRVVAEKLEAYGLTKGLDRQTARKQARGAARGYLGNALASEMLFTAPVSGWLWILSQRASRSADAEIRTIYTQVLKALKASRYGHFFEGLETEPAPDGMGEVLKA